MFVLQITYKFLAKLVFSCVRSCCFGFTCEGSFFACLVRGSAAAGCMGFFWEKGITCSRVLE